MIKYGTEKKKKSKTYDGNYTDQQQQWNCWPAMFVTPDNFNAVQYCCLDPASMWNVGKKPSIQTANKQPSPPPTLVLSRRNMTKGTNVTSKCPESKSSRAVRAKLLPSTLPFRPRGGPVISDTPVRLSVPQRWAWLTQIGVKDVEAEISDCRFKQRTAAF